MSFVAILNEVRNLEQLLRTGDRPLIVGSWSPAVVRAARDAGLPALLEDDVISRDTLLAIDAHADRLLRALAGEAIPAGRGFNDWGWWALEHPFTYVSHGGARTRLLLDALFRAAPDALAIAHDMEGFIQGGVVKMWADERGPIPVFAWTPERSLGDATTRRHDWEIWPGTEFGVRDVWQGKPLPKSNRPYIVMVHTNEVAHIVDALAVTGAPYFNLCQDRFQPWPNEFVGPVVDARPVSVARELEAPVWPERLTPLAHPWERGMFEQLMVTWQSALTEQHRWAEAAYRRAPVRCFLGGSDHMPMMRARVLACRDLGIPYVLVQHGAFLAHRPQNGYGHANHRFASHNLCYGREAARQLEAFGVLGRCWSIGWPQGTSSTAQLAWRKHAQAEASAERKPWLILPSGTASPDFASTSYKRADTFIEDVAAAIAAIDPATPVLVKLHPVSDNPVAVRAALAAGGLTNVRAEAGLDPWQAVAQSERVIAAHGTSVFTAIAMRKPLVVHHPWYRCWLARYEDVLITETRAELEDALRHPERWPAARTPLRYARVDANAGLRAVAALRRIVGVDGPIAERERVLVPKTRARRGPAQAPLIPRPA